MTIQSLSVPLSDGNNRPTQMPNLANRFRVFFSFDNLANEREYLLSNVISVSSISSGNDQVIIETYNSRIKLAGKHRWDDVNIVFRNDVDNKTVQRIHEQYSRQISMTDQGSPLSGKSYKFYMRIENLDGSTSNPEVLEEYTLEGCYIANFNSPDLNYSDSNYQQYQMTISFDNASHTIINSNVDTLTSNGFDNTGNNDASGGVDV